MKELPTLFDSSFYRREYNYFFSKRWYMRYLLPRPCYRAWRLRHTKRIRKNRKIIIALAECNELLADLETSRCRIEPKEEIALKSGLPEPPLRWMKWD